MRRFVSVLTGLLAVMIVAGSLAALSPVQAAPDASALQQRNVGARDSTCVANAFKTAFPNVMLLGETTTITLSIKAICAGEATPLHIVFVLDASGSMAGTPTTEMKKAVKELIRRLNMNDNPSTKVGVVQFNTVARTLCQLTNETGRASSCVNKVGASGGTSIDRGITEGLNVLRKGRSNGGGQTINEIMVVLSDGANNDGCQPVKQAAGRAKSQGVLVITVCVGGGCDAACMREVASSARYFYEVASASQLVQIFDRIRNEILNITLRSLEVTDIVPENMEYIPDSAEPPADVSDDQKTLEWRANFIPKEGITFTFEVRPLEVGYHRTNVSALGVYRDNQNRTGETEFPVPFVTVLQPFQQPTPAVPPPTPTMIPSPTPTNTPTDTPTPTPTPTERPGPIYIPIIVKEKCKAVEGGQFTDVVLVLDMSTSMDRMTPLGRSKRDAVIAAGQLFLDQLDLTPNEHDQYDQLSLVWFNDNAAIEVELTNDRELLSAALDRLPSRRAEGTRLDKALEVGTLALDETKRKLGSGTFEDGTPVPDNIPVMVLLTDGLPNRVPFGPGTEHPECDRQECTVLKYADLAKDTDIRLYTIGVGTRDAEDLIDVVLVDLLEATASEPSMFYLAPSAEDVSGIYAEILANTEWANDCHNSGGMIGGGR